VIDPIILLLEELHGRTLRCYFGNFPSIGMILPSDCSVTDLLTFTRGRAVVVFIYLLSLPVNVRFVTHALLPLTVGCVGLPVEWIGYGIAWIGVVDYHPRFAVRGWMGIQHGSSLFGRTADMLVTRCVVIGI